ncbi:MAG: hypothetical protein JSR23_11165, partial [Proteobacteria bacterium]|nr:hypothetical protein [Pseudomonadota bacterium]
MVTDPTSTPGSPVAAASQGHAPWLYHPSSVAEVEAQGQRFSDPALCVADVLCDDHPRTD